MKELKYGAYFVHETSLNKFEIWKHEPWYNTSAMMLNEGVFLWDYAPVFDSKFKAYSWLKNHISELI